MLLRVGEWADDLKELQDRAWPAVRDEQREPVTIGRAEQYRRVDHPAMCRYTSTAAPCGRNVSRPEVASAA
jgi:hypothetical protein